MNEAQIFVLADRSLNSVVAQIRDDQWSMPMPANFLTRQTDHTPTLREIINYHAYDDAWVPDMLTGKSMAAAGQEKFKGDLLGDDPRQSFSRLVDQAVAAAQAVDDFDRTVHCSFGDFSVREYFWQINSFRGLRAHDIARVIGVDANCHRNLSRGCGTRFRRTPRNGAKSACIRRPCRCLTTRHCSIACWA